MTDMADVMAMRDFIRTEEPEQEELFTGWKVKPSYFSLQGANRRAFGGSLQEEQGVRGTFEGVVTAVHVGRDRIVYDIQVLDAELEGEWA